MDLVILNLTERWGEENLPVLAAHLSDDRKAVFLSVPNMEEVMQMEVSYKIKNCRWLSYGGYFFG